MFETMVILDDITHKDNFYPFTQIRSLADLRIGILTIREKAHFITKRKIVTLSETGKGIDEKVIPANSIPSLPDKLLNSPWDMIFHNAEAIQSDYHIITHGRISQPLSPSNTTIAPQNIFLEDGVKAECCIINASEGPVYIGRDVQIMEGAIIRGPVAICEGAVIKAGAKIYGGTTIGPYCIAGGEIKNSILQGYSNKAHDGYLGDSMIGEWCNLGAGTSNSNIKNTAGEVKAWNNARKEYSVVGKKAGILMGDYSKCAINTSFNTGTVIGVCCNIFAPGLQPKLVPDFTWGAEKYELNKAFKDIDNWKQLKKENITEEEKQILTTIYNQ
jgi:UDP-N-acetylglucosamine diphosphorylase / glucose-1-phosphate thymidylyltransferase / UDP-N-acetylgalactosamine diphosphorylase / glucosamine-1-phosphate N-acetyltransferase / galactosamine-1-phosphate N-acetyltransferase